MFSRQKKNLGGFALLFSLAYIARYLQYYINLNGGNAYFIMPRIHRFNRRRKIQTEEKAMIVALLGGRIDSFHCRTSYIAPG